MIRQELVPIRKLEYRSARVPVTVGIHFVVNGATFNGSCHDVSESGARARFNLPVALGIEGLLTLHYRDGVVTRRALVACIQGRTVGFSFLPDEPFGLKVAIALVPKPSNAA